MSTAIDSPDLADIADMVEYLGGRQAGELSDQALSFLVVARAVARNRGVARATWASSARWLMGQLSETKGLF